MITKAYTYLRCSGDGQVTGDTWDRQQAAIRAYVSGSDIVCAGEFRDEGVPGKTEMMNRPGLASLLAAIEENDDVRMVIVETADRLARDLVVNELIIREFQRLKVKVVSASGGIVLTDGDDINPTAKLVRQILAAIAEFDRSVIVLKTRAARERLRAKNGKCEGRKAYGTRPGEETGLREILSMAAAGYQPTKIARMMNSLGFKTRMGLQWNSGTIYRIVRRQNSSAVSPANGSVTP